MNIPATNKTEQEQILAGEKIPAGTQASIREELISQKEISTIKEEGFVLARTSTGYVISGEGGKVFDGEVEHVTFPEKYVTKNGEVSKANPVKAAVAEFRELYENIISDIEFEEKYQGVNPGEYRVDDIGGDDAQ